jgi:hypothetical protein
MADEIKAKIKIGGPDLISAAGFVVGQAPRRRAGHCRLKNLANIDEVGHGIAVAFVATVYGVGAAN